MSKHNSDDFDPHGDAADEFDLNDLDLDAEDLNEDTEELGTEDTCSVCHSVLDEDGDCPNPECPESPYA